MSTSSQLVSKTTQSSSLAFGEVMIKGRIELTRVHDNKTYTRLVAPAKDEFSSPQQYEIRSQAMLGQLTEIVDIKCFLSGWAGKRFTYIDQTTGQQMSGQNMILVLDLV